MPRLDAPLVQDTVGLDGWQLPPDFVPIEPGEAD